MNNQTRSPLPASIRLTAAALLLALVAGCATTPPRPRVVYPVTYNVQVGNTQVNAPSGGQNLNVNATQEVTVVPGVPLYYRVESPVAVTVTVAQRTAPAPAGVRTELGSLQGTSFTTSITPAGDLLEFTFAVVQPNSSGTLQFTLSDQPLPPATATATKTTTTPTTRTTVP